MSWDAAAVCIISLVVAVHSADLSEKCDPSMSVEIPNAHMMSNGSAWDVDDGVLYSSDTFWTEGDKTYGCPCMLDRPCMRKCCSKNEAMDFKTLECIPHNESSPWFRPNLTVDAKGTTRVVNFGEFNFLYGNFCFGYVLEPEFYDEDEFIVDYDNGSLKTKMNSSAWYGAKDFCVDYFPEVDKYLPYLCFPGRKESIESDACHTLRFILYPIGMAVSIIFLILSLSVYAVEPKLRNLCGKCMIFYMSSLLCSYASLATIQALGHVLSDDACLVFGFIIYFSLLCTFFWLNVLCIDITLAFRSSQPIPGNPVDRERKKFMIYSLYAWGVPLVITTVTLIAELHPGMPDTIHKPNFQLTCWFHDDKSRLLYFICPVGIIVFCNLCLFIFTACNIYIINKKNQQCKTKADKRLCKKEDRKRLRIYIKLYVVMGVTWILEILSFLIGGSKCIWLFTDMINTLQGLFIFLILVCNRRVVRLLRRRFCPKVATPDDPPTRLGECGTSSEEEDDDDLPTSSTSTDANGVRGGRRRNEFKLRSKEMDQGISMSTGRGGGDTQRTGNK